MTEAGAAIFRNVSGNYELWHVDGPSGRRFFLQRKHEDPSARGPSSVRGSIVDRLISDGAIESDSTVGGRTLYRVRES